MEESRQYEIRLSRHEDIPRILEIYEDARGIMRGNGNLYQWTDGYPSEDVLLHDIANGNSYILQHPEHGIVGTFACILGEDPTYKKIYEGEWLDSTLPYCTIHRMASTASSHGIARSTIDYCYRNICPNIRIDTHRDNTIMQHILLAYGFQYCGIIYLLTGAERLAYQLIVE